MQKSASAAHRLKSAEVRLFDLRVGLEVGFLVERLAILDQLAEHDKTLVRVLVVGAIFVGTGQSDTHVCV